MAAPSADGEVSAEHCGHESCPNAAAGAAVALHWPRCGDHHHAAHALPDELKLFEDAVEFGEGGDTFAEDDKYEYTTAGRLRLCRVCPLPRVSSSQSQILRLGEVLLDAGATKELSRKFTVPVAVFVLENLFKDDTTRYQMLLRNLTATRATNIAGFLGAETLCNAEMRSTTEFTAAFLMFERPTCDVADSIMREKLASDADLFRDFARDVLSALHFVHDTRHGDKDKAVFGPLAPRHVWYFEATRTFKLFDLQLVRTLDRDEDTDATAKQVATMSGIDDAQLWGRPPEVPADSDKLVLTREADVWWCGALLWQVATNTATRAEAEAPLPPLLADLVHRMMCDEPDARLTAQECLDHPFFWLNERHLQLVSSVREHELPRDMELIWESVVNVRLAGGDPWAYGDAAAWRQWNTDGRAESWAAAMEAKSPREWAADDDEEERAGDLVTEWPRRYQTLTGEVMPSRGCGVADQAAPGDMEMYGGRGFVEVVRGVHAAPLANKEIEMHGQIAGDFVVRDRSDGWYTFDVVRTTHCNVAFAVPTGVTADVLQAADVHVLLRVRNVETPLEMTHPQFEPGDSDHSVRVGGGVNTTGKINDLEAVRLDLRYKVKNKEAMADIVDPDEDSPQPENEALWLRYLPASNKGWKSADKVNDGKAPEGLARIVCTSDTGDETLFLTGKPTSKYPWPVPGDFDGNCTYHFCYTYDSSSYASTLKQESKQKKKKKNKADQKSENNGDAAAASTSASNAATVLDVRTVIKINGDIDVDVATLVESTGMMYLQAVPSNQEGGRRGFHLLKFIRNQAAHQASARCFVSVAHCAHRFGQWYPWLFADLYRLAGMYYEHLPLAQVLLSKPRGGGEAQLRDELEVLAQEGEGVGV